MGLPIAGTPPQLFYCTTQFGVTFWRSLSPNQFGGPLLGPTKREGARLLSRNDEKLIQGLKAGDPAAQKAFYQEHVDNLCAWINASGLRDSEDLKEILGDTFMRAFTGIKKFEGRSKIKTWLFSLARRAAVDYYRVKRNQSIQSDEDLNDTPDVFAYEGQFFKPAFDADENRVARRLMLSRNGEVNEDAAKDKTDQVYQVLGQLTVPHQRILILRFINDMSISEAAQILGKTMGAVKMMQMRAAEAFKALAEKNQLFPEMAVREK